MKRNVNPVTFITKKVRIRIANTLFKAKLQAVSVFFAANFKSNCCFYLPVVPGSERLHSEASLLKTRKLKIRRYLLVLKKMGILKKS